LDGLEKLEFSPQIYITMKQILYCLLFVSTILGAQNTGPQYIDPSLIFEKLRPLMNGEAYDVDSTIYYLEKLQEVKPDLAETLLANSFFLNYRSRIHATLESQRKLQENTHSELEASDRSLLIKIAEGSNSYLKNEVNAMYLWRLAFEEQDDINALKKYTTKFTAEELTKQDLHEGRRASYGLHFYLLLMSKNELAEAKKLMQKLREGIPVSEKLPRTTMNIRDQVQSVAWHHFIYAATFYLEAQMHKDGVEKEALLRQAFEYSPNRVDQKNIFGYFLEPVFLGLKEKTSFREDYYQYIKSRNKSDQELLAILSQMATNSPEYLPELEKFYQEHPIAGKPFTQFWLEKINEMASESPDFKLLAITGKEFNSLEKRGKWILLDFWGTWCSPCRAEHPALQALSKEIETKYAGQMEVLTIACQDQLAKVEKYFQQTKYDFPTAMADDKITDLFKVTGYPTKILITPQGRQILLPGTLNWSELVKTYANLK
jgi:thiol-disulfide isomerase/thioredoxin